MTYLRGTQLRALADLTFSPRLVINRFTFGP